MNYGRHRLDFNGTCIKGKAPLGQLTAQNGRCFWQSEEWQPQWDQSAPAPQQLKRALMWACQQFPSGGALGYMGYEAGRFAEPSWHPQASPLPDWRLVFYEELVKRPEAVSTLDAPPTRAVPDRPEVRSAYQEGVRRVLEYIAAGDIYQANVTHRFQEQAHHSPEAFYDRLKAFGPAPQSALLQWEDFSIICNSPESFLTLKDGVLTAAPIKGTAPRGPSPNTDAQWAQKLANSQKDRAENVMIVDLMRNDLGRVCTFGSVQVPELFLVKSFPNLHHLQSTVVGQLRQDKTALDAFWACFPCGSITGAPKVRTLQILTELEPCARGAAMGAIGYFGFDGGMEWNVAIRTATQQNGQVNFHAGGGIVADSTPESEYQEMLLKARALWSACAP